MPSIHLLIVGKVQGVFYRVSAKEKADEIGIAGWVKNTKEGNVEAVATGSNEQLEMFTQWCYKGPKRAVVDKVIVTKIPDAHFNNFEVVRKT